MYCANCGTMQPINANFCPQCGNPQKDGLVPAGIGVKISQVEVCEITYSILKKGMTRAEYQFWAESTGPKGKYKAASSPSFIQPTDWPPDSSNPQTVWSYEELVATLESEGWTRLSRGDRWYNTRFQRLIQ